MHNKIETTKVKQNNQEFLLGVFTTKQVFEFTKYTKRLIIGFKEEEDVSKIAFDELSQITPEYNSQIQRNYNNAKVDRIADYLITDPQAMFPTNIVIGIPKEVIESQSEKDKKVIITLSPIVKQELSKVDGDVFLTIIDGQHRIKGIERAIERLNAQIENLEKNISKKEVLIKKLERIENLELIITFFVDPILEYQAMIFSTINKTQTKVPENLVYSLFGLTKEDTPQKTALEVVIALNGIEKSPFYNRVKLAGGTYKRGENIPLSQATMVKSILYQISKNLRESEIDRTKERRELINNPNNLVFRPYYADNNDRMIIRILYTFFSAARETFINQNNSLSYWDFESTTETNVLQTNIGFQALLKLLIDILKITDEDKKDSKSYYAEILSSAKNKIDFEDNKQDKNYPFTSKSILLLYNDLKKEIPILSEA